MFTCPACGQPDLHFHNVITPGETAAVGLLRGEMLTSIKERLSDLQEAAPMLLRMAEGRAPSHRGVDAVFLRNTVGKLDALENATRGLLGLAAYAVMQSLDGGTGIITSNGTPMTVP
jgi:hypothetical protein